MHRLPHILFVILVSLAAYSCKHAPKYVLGKEKMAQVLADMHVGEIVVDMNHQEFQSDSMKQLLKQSILDRHGVNQHDFDTSLVWYGHNIDKYIEVYERTIEILDARNRSLGNAIVQSAISLSGDSVDVWPGAKYARFNKRLPSAMVQFDLDTDDNSEPGDVYTWRSKILNDEIRTLRWGILAIYTDSTCEWLTSNTSSNDWNEVVFATDSTRTLAKMRGFMEVVVHDGRRSSDNNDEASGKDMWIDSISLVRKRSNPDISRQRSRLHQSSMY